jgi:Uma2 family endonuclease
MDAAMLEVGEKYISADEFWTFVNLPENREKRFELVEGVIVEVAGGTGGDHGEVGSNITGFIWLHVREHKLGRVTSAETCYRLWKNPERRGKDTVRCPDVGFVMLERAPKPFGPGYVPFAPDLAVEVVSPGNDANEIHEKVLDYLKYGVRLVWVIYPESKTVFVHHPSGSKILTVDDMLEGADVLPGFTLAVKDIFPQ